MAALTKMFSGSSARKGTMAAEAGAQAKRAELSGLDEDDAMSMARRKAREAAANRNGVASTRLASDTILGGSAPLG